MIFVFFIGISAVCADPVWALSEQVRENLRQRIESAGVPPRLSVGEEVIYSSVVLPDFYIDRTFIPAWSDDSGSLPVADSLVSAIAQADREGLFPEDYHLEKIREVLDTVRAEQKPGQTPDSMLLVDLDLLLTDAFLVYASHLFGGKLDPVSLDPEWHPARHGADFAGILEKALAENRVHEALLDLLPAHREYFRLRDVLANYRKIASEGGWPQIPTGPAMKKGSKGELVTALRQRLMLTGDLKPDAFEESDDFDELLEEAVRRYQGRHGLETDGIVGRQTFAELNTPVEQRLEQVMINLERWRWLPQSLGERYILVNIAGFELEVVENGQKVMTMRTIVGRHYRRTPVFTGTMTYLVFSPFWNIPSGIVAKDVLPQVKKDIAYLEKNNIRVFQGWGANTVPIDPATISWSEITPANLRYRFRQDPGPDNALGQVKFMFPNRFNVYLHDTPARELFLKTVRNFSSGCIRVEDPVSLAEYLLADRPAWRRAEIEAAMERNVERTVTITDPLPVHLLYWTAWATEEQEIHFRQDIYNRDKHVSKALQPKSVTGGR